MGCFRMQAAASQSRRMRRWTGAVKAAVAKMKEDGAFSTVRATESVNDTLKLPAVDLTGVKAAGAYVITEDELESGITRRRAGKVL